jgi:hypothetical protein
MPVGIVIGLAIALGSSSARAQKLTFAELLARAETQAAAGHRWEPAGDNMAETISGMMELIATATPQQLAELSALLKRDVSPSAKAPPIVATTEPERPGIEPLTATTTEPERPVAEPSTAVAMEQEQPATRPSERDRSVSRPDVTSTASERPAQAVTTIDQSIPAPPVTAAEQKPPPTSAATTTASPVRPISRPAKTGTLEDRPVPGDSLAPSEADRPAKPVVAIPSRPGARAMELFVRGQKAVQSGDISGARRLYASAAQQGIAAAARDLGRLYDPAYLKQTALGGIDPDPILARHWYEQAVTMGDVEAGPLLDALALR